MFRLLKLLALTPLALTLGVLSTASHPASMQTAMHQMPTTHHETSNGANCATLCRTAVVSKSDEITENDENIDDQNNTPSFVAQQDRAHSDYITSVGRRYVANFHPPPKIGAHILFGVYRS